jgi:hypothetical protein
VLRVEVRCSYPCPEVTNVTIQVSSPCNSAPGWYVRNTQIREEFGVPLFADIRALTATFDSKLADVGTP